MAKPHRSTLEILGLDRHRIRRSCRSNVWNGLTVLGSLRRCFADALSQPTFLADQELALALY